MTDGTWAPNGSWWKNPRLYLSARLQEHEDQVFLVLALVIGALTGLTVVAFILLTERAGMQLYPLGGARWRRLVFPVGGSLGIGYLLYPINFLVWAYLLREPAETSASTGTDEVGDQDDVTPRALTAAR